GSWTSHSQYPELSARAVLFSIPSFDQDYDHHARVRLRQALMYAQRTTAFGPVRFPAAMGIDIQAMRQWAELLFTVPEQLEKVTNEIELYSISWYYFWKFHAAFNRELERQDGTLAHDIVMTETEVGFMPMASILPVLRSVTPRVIRKRLMELSELVSASQEVLTKIDAQESRPDYERVFRPLTQDERRELAELHGVKEHDLEEWASFRALLNLYGSLVRKVGFSVVPEHSLVGSVAWDDNGYMYNRLGDIALRVGHLANNHNFVPGVRAVRVKIAHSREEYQQLISGSGQKASQEVRNG
ncbi:MAG: hypothetical protein KDD62_14795, partial [Bdellovibrionales bacterium]|nr:hypothetical protein [Bdellovibrionales bacterium]